MTKMIQNRHISLNRLKRQMFLRDHFNWRNRLFAPMSNNKSWQLSEALSKHSRAFCWTMETSTCIIKMILRWTFCCREDPVGLPWLFGWWDPNRFTEDWYVLDHGFEDDPEKGFVLIYYRGQSLVVQMRMWYIIHVYWYIGMFGALWMCMSHVWNC